jgi:hypothetical protein
VTRILLANRFPMLLWWGPEYIQVYNDAYRPILGTRHPTAIGQPARECWADIWHVIGTLIEIPFHGGPATWVEDLQLECVVVGLVGERAEHRGAILRAASRRRPGEPSESSSERTLRRGHATDGQRGRFQSNQMASIRSADRKRVA